MKRLTWILLMALLAGPMASRAQTGITGYELLEWCESDSIECLTYIAGVIDTLNVLVATRAIPRKWCASGVTLGQIERTVVEFMRTKPENLHETASSFVPLALVRAFPCK